MPAAFRHENMTSRVREQRRMESIADIRMRASEEAMKAQREALGLN
jgi:hypothetical protein